MSCAVDSILLGIPTLITLGVGCVIGFLAGVSGRQMSERQMIEEITRRRSARRAEAQIRADVERELGP